MIVSGILRISLSFLVWLDITLCLPKISAVEEVVIGRSGKRHKILVEKSSGEARPMSFIDEEKMNERHISEVKVRIENKVLLSMWVPVDGTEVRIDFTPNTNSMWEGTIPYVIRGDTNNSLRFESYRKQCHFKSQTPSALAHMSTCDGSLTGTIILKNEIYIVDPNFLRRVKLISKNSAESDIPPSMIDHEITVSNSNETFSNYSIDYFDPNVNNITELENFTYFFNDSNVETDTNRYAINLVPRNETEPKYSEDHEDDVVIRDGWNDKNLLILDWMFKQAKVANSTIDKEPSRDNSAPVIWKNQQDLDLLMKPTDESELEWSHPDAPLITHTIKKRSINETFEPAFCGVSKVESVPLDPEEQQGMAIMANAQSVDYDRWTTDLIIELAVFADHHLFQKYLNKYSDRTSALSKLQDFIASTLNNAQLMYQHESIRPKVQFKVVRYEVLETQPYQLNVGSNADAYLSSFCNYQYYLRSREFNWDHAVLFTGHDLIRYNEYTRRYEQSISGIARLYGLCSSQNSCLLAEALDFNAAFILAHEIGHSLGMNHDEPRCPSSFIMSQSLGGGKVKWSTCSVSEFQKFLNRLDVENRNCMLTLTQYKQPAFQLSTDDLPGIKYTAMDQCILVYGTDFYPEQAYNTNEDMCYLMWCRKRNGGQYFSSHPALEGTECAAGRRCRNGKCTDVYYQAATPVHGGWSGWSTVDCRYCYCPDIDNSLAVIKTYRTCTSPAPSNGGSQCYGTEIRGLVCNRGCSSSQTTKYTVDQYITRICTEHKNKRHGWNLLGTGRQMTFYEDRACKIFCDVVQNGVTKKTSFGDLLPNGTPCGNGRYCLDGQCLTLGCDNTAIVATETDCPASTEQKCLSALREPIVTWTGWSVWSPCSATCGLGIKKKARSCVTVATSSSPSVLTSGCEGHDAEKSSCSMINCPRSELETKQQYDYDKWSRSYGEYGHWSAWGSCSATCGHGLQQRKRNCLQGEGKCFGADQQERECYAPACPAWGGWGYWSSCSSVTRERRRIRKCYGGNEVCPGNEMDVDYC